MDVPLCPDVRLVAVIPQILVLLLKLLYNLFRIVLRAVIRHEYLDELVVADLLQYAFQRFLQILATVVGDDSVGEDRTRFFPLSQQRAQFFLIRRALPCSRFRGERLDNARGIPLCDAVIRDIQPYNSVRSDETAAPDMYVAANRDVLFDARCPSDDDLARLVNALPHFKEAAQMAVSKYAIGNMDIFTNMDEIFYFNTRRRRDHGIRADVTVIPDDDARLAAVMLRRSANRRLVNMRMRPDRNPLGMSKFSPSRNCRTFTAGIEQSLFRRVRRGSIGGKEAIPIRSADLKGNFLRLITAKRRLYDRHDNTIAAPRKIPTLFLHGIILSGIVCVPRDIILCDKKRRQYRPNIRSDIRRSFSESHLLEHAARGHEHTAVFVRSVHDIRAQRQLRAAKESDHADRAVCKYIQHVLHKGQRGDAHLVAQIDFILCIRLC